MIIREILIRWEHPVRKARITPDSRFAFDIDLTDLASSAEQEEIKRESRRLGDPMILLPVNTLPGVTPRPYSVFTAYYFARNNYVQLQSGLIVPNILAEEARLPSKEYRPTQEIRVTSGLDFTIDPIGM